MIQIFRLFKMNYRRVKIPSNIVAWLLPLLSVLIYILSDTFTQHYLNTGGKVELKLLLVCWYIFYEVLIWVQNPISEQVGKNTDSCLVNKKNRSCSALCYVLSTVFKKCMLVRLKTGSLLFTTFSFSDIIWWGKNIFRIVFHFLVLCLVGIGWHVGLHNNFIPGVFEVQTYQTFRSLWISTY